MLAALNAGFPAVQDLTAARARELVAARVPPVSHLDEADAEDVDIEGPGGRLRLRVYRPRRDVERPAPGVVFLHGGGFVFCDIESHDGFCRRFASRAGAIVVSVDYRLAPEHPAPAAAQDAYAATAWLADGAAGLGVDGARLLVAGDSAGGNLAAVVCLMARDRGGPAIAGQVLAYPVIEPDMETDSHRRYGAGFFNTTAAMRWYWEQYLGSVTIPERLDCPTEYVAPLHARDLAGLPAAIVVSAGRDPLRDEGVAYVTALRDSGVTVRHREYPELFHGFLTIAGFPPALSAQELLWSDVAHLLGAARATTRRRVDG